MWRFISSLSDLGVGLHRQDLEAQPVSDSRVSGLLTLGSGGPLLQTREFKYLGVLYMGDRRMERKMDRRFV